MGEPITLKPMPAFEVRACKRCAFYIRDPKEQAGVCRFNPPQLIVMPQKTALGQVGAAMVATFPAVNEDAWCGQFALVMGMAHSAN